MTTPSPTRPPGLMRTPVGVIALLLAIAATVLAAIGWVHGVDGAGWRFLASIAVGGAILTALMVTGLVRHLRWSAPAAAVLCLHVLVLIVAFTLSAVIDSPVELGGPQPAPTPAALLGSLGLSAVGLLAAAALAALIWSLRGTTSRADRRSAALTGAVSGLVTACAVGGYAWAAAVPDRMVGEVTTSFIDGPRRAFIIAAVALICAGVSIVAASRRPHAAAVAGAALLLPLLAGVILAVAALPVLVRNNDFAQLPGPESTGRAAIAALSLTISSLILLVGALAMTVADDYERSGERAWRRDIGTIVTAVVAILAVVGTAVVAEGVRDRTTVGTGTISTEATSELPTLAADGPRVVFRHEFGTDEMSNMVAIADAFVVRNPQTIAAYDSATAALRWSRPLVDLNADGIGSSSAYGSLVGIDSPTGAVVVIRGSSGRLASLDARDGRLLWWTGDALSLLNRSGRHYDDALVASQKHIPIDSDLRTVNPTLDVLSLDPRTGHQRWSWRVPGNSGGNSCSVDGDVSETAVLVSNDCDGRSGPRYLDLRTGTPREGVAGVRARVVNSAGERFLIDNFDSEPLTYLNTSPSASAPRTVPGTPVTDVRGGVAIVRGNSVYDGVSLFDVQSGRISRITGIFDVSRDSAWSWVGDNAIGQYTVLKPEFAEPLAIVSSTGRFRSIENPCGNRRRLVSSPVVASGSVLIPCGNGDGRSLINSVVALR